MSSRYWTALDLLRQVAGELGLPVPTSLIAVDDKQSVQLLAFLNSAGNELLELYPWGNLLKEWTFFTENDVGEYALPDDWSYFIDQTQWDRTSHWPLLGPKSPQEWAWLKGGLLAAAPRMRYRVIDNKFAIWPVPQANSNSGPTVPPPFELSMEYVRTTWVQGPDGPDDLKDMVTANGDIVLYNPWMVIKFIKLKFYELKGFDTSGVRQDFLRIFQSLTGKDKGAPRLSLSPRFPPIFIGPWSVPDGSWDVNSGGPV